MLFKWNQTIVLGATTRLCAFEYIDGVETYCEYLQSIYNNYDNMNLTCYTCDTNLCNGL